MNSRVSLRLYVLVRFSLSMPLGILALITGLTSVATAIPLPDNSTVNSASPALQITNAGTGRALFFTNNRLNSGVWMQVGANQ